MKERENTLANDTLRRISVRNCVTLSGLSRGTNERKTSQGKNPTASRTPMAAYEHWFT